MKKVLLLLLSVHLFSTLLLAQLASDNAGNYTTWTNGSNLGTGFSAWDLWTQNTGVGKFAGHYLGSSSGQGFGDINTSSKAFAMYGNPAGSFPQANAQRGFNYTYNSSQHTSLQDGHTFKIQLAIAWRGTGYKGIDLYTTGFVNTYNILNVASDQYTINGENQSWSYSQTSIFTIEVTQTSSTQIYLKVTRGTDVYGPTAITTASRIAYFKCYVGNTANDGDLNNLYFNNLEIRGDNPLPVELTSFAGKVTNGKVSLNWNTATEVNNYGFEIERAAKVNGDQNVQFAKVGFVEGNGNSNSPKSYTFTDASVTAGKYLYRLKQVDTDGQFEYSQEIEVSVDNLINGYVLEQNYPNPFNPSTSIKFGFQNDTRAEVKVYNVIGAEVSTLFSGMADAGRIYEVTFDASGLASGTYFYKLVTPEKTDVRKMILMK